MQVAVSPRPSEGPALLAHYGVRLIHELANVPELRTEIDAVAEVNEIGDVRSFFLKRAERAWDGETERLFIVAERGFAEISLPSLRVAHVGTLFPANAQLAFPTLDLARVENALAQQCAVATKAEVVQ